ncbi:hypothetical protein DICVIV_07133 [Dictyocaulus viviparus]|uniref:Endoplasmic reticulum-Golgi intermediate compartment protein 3 n=1 Tax=Dictyocaulus viviparus TaxID=29172 RepID=A0A0D8XSN8_DICVI|nr:hypothetical protein DICVIV_07133 [Dictyocaulus viviparus]
MSNVFRSQVSDVDLGRVMGICRCLNLSFTEEQVLAIIAVIEAGAYPSSLVEWLRKMEESKVAEMIWMFSSFMSFFNRLRDFDAYTKPMDDFRVKTFTGGMVSVISTAVIILLAIQETMHYLRGDIVEQLYVDSTSSDVRLDVHFDVTFHRLPCAFITVDVMDVSSENQDNIQDDIFKLRLDSSGNKISDDVQRIEVNQNKTSDALAMVTPECGSCYGALPNGSCCNTCDQVKEAYQLRGWQINVEVVEQCKEDSWVEKLKSFKGEGCQVYGKLQVAKVAGNFHFAPGDAHRIMRAHIHDFHSLDLSHFDTGHRINHLSFGDEYPGKQYPLNGKNFDEIKGPLMHNYYVKVVPTSYVYIDGRVENSHQFSVTIHQKDIRKGITGFFSVYFIFPPLYLYLVTI